MKYYKYYPPKEYVLDSLEKGFFYFSFPDKLNDPFDTYLSFELFGDKDEWIKFLINELHWTLENAEQYFYDNKIIDDKPYTIPLFENNYRMAYVISSFTTEPDNTLMWSHYSEGHKGFCFGYNTIKPSNFYLIKTNDKRKMNTLVYDGSDYLPLREINYLSKKPKPFNPLKDDPKVLLNNVIQKSDIWKYENEYRLAIEAYDPRKNIVYYDKTILRDIYVGLNTDKALINEIIKICKFVYNSDVEIHYPIMHSREYSVKFG